MKTNTKRQKGGGANVEVRSSGVACERCTAEPKPTPLSSHPPPSIPPPPRRSQMHLNLVGDDKELVAWKLSKLGLSATELSSTGLLRVKREVRLGKE